MCASRIETAPVQKIDIVIAGSEKRADFSMRNHDMCSQFVCDVGKVCGFEKANELESQIRSVSLK